MLLYKFGSRRSQVVLTQDKTGSNLPEDGRPWKPLGARRVDVSDGSLRIGADPAHIIAVVEREGSLSFQRANEQDSQMSKTLMWDDKGVGGPKSSGAWWHLARRDLGGIALIDLGAG